MAASSHRAQAPERERLRRLAAWRTEFEAPDFVVGRWAGGERGDDGVIQMPWFEYSPTVERFHQALGRDGWLQPFDWPAWLQRPEHRRLLDEPEGIADLDAPDLGRLLTAIFRSDRFSEGSVAGAFERGHILAIVQRAGVLAEEGLTEPPTVPP